jgi:hypothetical protein
MRDRNETLAHYRRILDLLEAHPDLPAPHLDPWGASWHDVSDPDVIRAIRRALGIAKLTKCGRDSSAWLRGGIDGFAATIFLDQSCELVEDGVEEVVVEDIPDDVREQYTRIEQRPKFRRVCPPILADTEVTA